MNDYAELYGVDRRQTLQFFFGKLWKEVERMGAQRQETLYVASILASYALTLRLSSLRLKMA